MSDGVEHSSELPLARSKQAGLSTSQFPSSVCLPVARSDHCIPYFYPKCRPSAASYSSQVKSFRDFQKQVSSKYRTGKAKSTWSDIESTKTDRTIYSPNRFMCTFPRDSHFQCFAFFFCCYLPLYLQIICIAVNDSISYI